MSNVFRITVSRCSWMFEELYQIKTRESVVCGEYWLANKSHILSGIKQKIIDWSDCVGDWLSQISFAPDYHNVFFPSSSSTRPQFNCVLNHDKEIALLFIRFNYWIEFKSHFWISILTPSRCPSRCSPSPWRPPSSPSAGTARSPSVGTWCSRWSCRVTLTPVVRYQIFYC